MAPWSCGVAARSAAVRGLIHTRIEPVQTHVMLAHAVVWVEGALFAVPAGVVVISIVRSLRSRRVRVPSRQEEILR